MVDRDEQTGEDEVREKDRGGRTRWRRGGEGRGGEAKSNAATPDGRPLSRCGGEGDGRRGRGRVGNGWGLGLGLGKGRRRGHIRLGASFGPARGAWLPGPRPLARSRPLAGAGEAGRGRPTVGVAGPDRAEVVLAGRAVPPGRPNWRPKHGLVHGPCLARAR